MYIERLSETIAAIATAKGSSIGIIRISGNDSLKIAQKIINTDKLLEPRKAYFVKISDNYDNIFDEAVVLFFKSPSSFTGEDVVEFHLHGSGANTEEILDKIISMGAKPAFNGEFSFRAVINGKMPLNKSMDLSALIAAEDTVSLEFARKQAFKNSFMEYLKSTKDAWEKFYVLFTAIVDFPDFMDDYVNRKELLDLIDTSISVVSKIEENNNSLRKFENFSIIIAGKPNVGKSSLFNKLLNRQRAIVNSQEGTTRDYITEIFYLGKNKIELTDTAGIRIASSEIEAEGISSAKKLLQNSDFIIYVIDGSKIPDEEDKNSLKNLDPQKTIIVVNKSDIATDFSRDFLSEFKIFNISAKTEDGLENLKKEIEIYVSSLMPDINTPVFNSKWQMQIAENFHSNLNELKEQINFENIEIISILLKETYDLLLKLIGESDDHSIYDKIFSSFCIGK